MNSRPTSRSPAMGFIMATVLIDMISVGLIIPVLPQLVGSFAHSPGEQIAAYGTVATAFAIANFLSSPVLGALSDRFGRRPVLLMGFTGLACSFFITAIATELWMLVVVRLFSGAMNANAAVANAYVADITPPEQRGKRYGMLGAMFGLGFILGPVIGGILGGRYGLRAPFFAAGALAVCNGLYGFFVLPESLPSDRRRAFSWARANPIASLMHLFELKGIGALLIVIAMGSLAQFMLHTTWALYTGHKFGWNPEQIGYSLLAVGVMSVLGQGLLAGPFTKWLGAPRLMVAGMVSSGLCYLAWGLASQGWEMYAAIFANVVGFAAGAAGQTVISNAADPKSQGQTMGAVTGLSSLMMVIAPILGPRLLQPFADLPPTDWRVGMPYYLGGALLLAAAVLASVHFARLRRAPAAAAAS
ncbi:MFS transporter [Roseateles saccharophilus]|nr:MFS transporter [Roseateles saccharophilus]